MISNHRNDRCDAYIKLKFLIKRKDAKSSGNSYKLNQTQPITIHIELCIWVLTLLTRITEN